MKIKMTTEQATLAEKLYIKAINNIRNKSRNSVFVFNEYLKEIVSRETYVGKLAVYQKKFIVDKEFVDELS